MGRRRLVVFAVLRTVATVALVLALYFLLPLGGGTNVQRIIKLTLGALLLTAIITWQVRQIIRSQPPGGPSRRSAGVQCPALHAPLRYNVFCNGSHESGRVGAPVSRTDAMYFSSTVFSTVGLGDITAKSEAARLVVTVQMWLDLVFLGFGVARGSPRRSNTASSAARHRDPSAAYRCGG